MRRFILIVIIISYSPVTYASFGNSCSCSQGVRNLAFSTIPSDIIAIEREIHEAYKTKDYQHALKLSERELELCQKKAKEGQEIYYYYYLRAKVSSAAVCLLLLDDPQNAIVIYDEIIKELYPIIGKEIENDMPYLGMYLWTIDNRAGALWVMGEKEKARETKRELKKEIDALLIKYFGSADYELLMKQSEEGKLKAGPVRIKTILRLADIVSHHIETNMKVFEEYDEERKKAEAKISETTPTDTKTTPTYSFSLMQLMRGQVKDKTLREAEQEEIRKNR